MLNLDDTSFDYADRITQTLRYAKPMTARALFELIFVFLSKACSVALEFEGPIGEATGTSDRQSL